MFVFEKKRILGENILKRVMSAMTQRLGRFLPRSDVHVA